MPPETFATATVAPDLAAAQIVRGALEAEGITCFLPDEQTAGQLWHLSRALGGIRVEVRAEDLDRARAVLEEVGQGGEAPDPSEAHEEVSPAERMANRALKISVLGFLLWPLFHPYALSLGLRALRDRSISRGARRQARFASFLSVAAIVGFFAALYAALTALARP
jgi:hypothetical protein